MTKKKSDPHAEFKAALRAAGAEILKPLTEYELVRFKVHKRTSIVYRSKKGKISFQCDARVAWEQFEKSKTIAFLPPRPKQRKKPAATRPAPRPSATIFADASLCPHTRAAGWGAWMKGNATEAFLEGGELRRLAKSSSEAEFCALVNAIFRAERRGLIEDGRAVMLQSDNIRALGIVLSHVPAAIESRHAAGKPVNKIGIEKLSETEIQALRILIEIQSRLKVEFVVRHVKGHKAGEGRQWVNRRCDEIARKHMLVRRAKEQRISA